MSLSGSIRAGAAYVEVTAQTSKLQRGLATAQAQLQNFGRSCTAIGKDMLMLSGAFAVPMAMAVKGFAEFDDQMRLVRAGKGHSIFFDIFLIFKLLYRRIHAYIYAGSDINAKAERSAMKSPILYFAYGSNMNPLRMGQRCPGATALGVGILRNYRLAERLYADIDFREGAEVHGVLFLITDQHLRSLDAREGYPKVYRRVWLDVEFQGETYLAVTYEMSAATKAVRSGQKYPEEYRKICSEGAHFHHVKNGFTTKRKATK